MRISHIVLIEDNPADVLLVKMALKENGVACEILSRDGCPELAQPPRSLSDEFFGGLAAAFPMLARRFQSIAPRPTSFARSDAVKTIRHRSGWRRN
jgi:hypothetical protein